MVDVEAQNKVIRKQDFLCTAGSLNYSEHLGITIVIGEELLKYLGGAPLLIAILVIFWKGDESISKEFRQDITNWLKKIKNIESYKVVLKYVNIKFISVFGVNHFTPMCFTKSFLFSTIFVVLICFAYFSIYDLNVEFFIAAFIFSLLPNTIGDYLSLFETRQILSRIENGSISIKLSLIIDFFLSLLIAVAAFIVAVVIGVGITSILPFLDSVLPAPGSVSDLREFKWLFLSINNKFLVFSVPLLTTFMTSIWIWMTALGSFSVRIAPKVFYILPIDEKPVRSIGIAATTVSILVLILIEALPELKMAL